MSAAARESTLREPRPAVSRGRLARAQVIAVATRFLAAFFRLLPWRAAQAVGRPLGRLAWRFSRRDRYRMMKHLAVAFPERSPAELERLCRACYAHLGTTATEVLWLFTRDCRAVLRLTETEGLERVLALRASGRPILFVTGHCGNWELLAARINCSGLGMTVVVRALDEPPLQRLVESFRARFGTRAVERGEAGAARLLLRSLRGGALGMLIDQDTRVDGVWVPFFGRPAYTPVGAARLALRRDAAVIPIFIERRRDGSHLARFEPPLELPDDEMEATALMTRAIEEQIRRVPEQWVWMHRRWRRQPE
ncbi:MAG: lysophospholipid acyltransferase family protein [Thermoanaerobaculia bacterium]